MRKKMLFLAFALGASLGALTSAGAVTTTTHGCSFCTTYADGSQCCHGCVCDKSGLPIACTQNVCPDPDQP